MNVFDWSGPYFLLFYVWLSVVLFMLGREVRRRCDRAPSGGHEGTTGQITELNDPCLVACLRDGAEEAVRFCIVDMTSRGELVMTGTVLRATPDASDTGGSQLERAIARAARNGANSLQILDDHSVQAQAAKLEAQLSAMGYCSVPRTAPVRVALYTLFAGAGTMIALYELQSALQRGERHVGQLIALVVVLWIALAFAMFPRRTSAGDHALVALRQRYTAALSRCSAQTSGASCAGRDGESSWLIAVFGLSVLASVHPALEEALRMAHESDRKPSWDMADGDGANVEMDSSASDSSG